MNDPLKPDHVARVLDQWKAQRPDLDCSPMSVIGRLARVHRLLGEGVNSLFKEFELSQVEFDILATLRRTNTPLTPTELYQTLMLSSGAMSTRVEALVRRGLLERLPSTEDSRSNQVQLTEEGLALIDEAVTAHVANEDKLLEPLSGEDREQLARLLQKWLLGHE